MLTATPTRRMRPGAGRYGHGAAYGQVAVPDPHVALFGCLPDGEISSGHPLQDPAYSRHLMRREHEITAAFSAIEPVLKEVAALQHQDGYAARMQALVHSRLGFELPVACLEASWIKPLNMRKLYAYSVFQTFRRLAESNFDRTSVNHTEGEPADELIRKWGFHAIDITPCADGRLSGVVDYILRVPPAVVAYRKSFAGAMFDIEESLRHWEQIELRRHREGVPNRADETTRYLKIGVYHSSGSDPAHEGCAAHGSDERRAAQALLDRLNAFARAIENTHCCAASVATLLIGVDTDCDAIKLHVPDAGGTMSLDRYVDNRELFEAVRGLGREEAKEAIRAAVAGAAGVALDDSATEGMRWFCGYLLKNNMAQIEYVHTYHNGRYADLGHTERFITVGDSFDDVQLRNLAYQAQMETIEEGTADMDVGIKIFKKVNVAHDLPIPVLIHFRYDGRVPGSRDRAMMRSLRLERAIHTRYPELARAGWLYTYVTIKDRDPGSRLEEVERPAQDESAACGCNKAESAPQ